MAEEKKEEQLPESNAHFLDPKDKKELEEGAKHPVDKTESEEEAELRTKLRKLETERAERVTKLRKEFDEKLDMENCVLVAPVTKEHALNLIARFFANPHMNEISIPTVIRNKA